jgi:hypothetical protein
MKPVMPSAPSTRADFTSNRDELFSVPQHAPLPKKLSNKILVCLIWRSANGEDINLLPRDVNGLQRFPDYSSLSFSSSVHNLLKLRNQLAMMHVRLRLELKRNVMQISSLLDKSAIALHIRRVAAPAPHYRQAGHRPYWERRWSTPAVAQRR